MPRLAAALDGTRLGALLAPPKGASDEKSIWGSGAGGFMDFMGINTASGGDEINDTPGDYTRAATAESYVYKCLNVRGNALGQAPLRAWELKRDGTRGDSVDHDALALLRFTNPMTGHVRGTSELMRYTLGSLDLHGRSGWRLATNLRGTRPTEIYWQSPATFSPVSDPKTFFGGLKILGTTEVIPPERCVYLRTPNYADPLMGTSKIMVLKQAINLRRYSVRSNLSFFKNSQRPDWMLSGNFANTQENMQRIRRALAKWLTGEHNRSPLILGEGATAHLLTPT